jgi:hypothetical protein
MAPLPPPPAGARAPRRWLTLGLAALAAACSASGSDERAAAPASASASPAPAAPAAQPLAAATPAASAAAPAGAEATTVTVYKSPTCGCCANWVEHMQKHGYKVVVHDTEEMAPVKAQLGVPEAMGSCHTATVGGYVLEGHVPAADVDRLLRERPVVLGIAVPGMPTGSPGMEVPGAPADRYDVVTFERGGGSRTFASH